MPRSLRGHPCARSGARFEIRGPAALQGVGRLTATAEALSGPTSGGYRPPGPADTRHRASANWAYAIRGEGEAHRGESSGPRDPPCCLTGAAVGRSAGPPPISPLRLPGWRPIDPREGTGPSQCPLVRGHQPSSWMVLPAHRVTRSPHLALSGCCRSELEECWSNGSHLNSRPDRSSPAVVTSASITSSGSMTAHTGGRHVAEVPGHTARPENPQARRLAYRHHRRPRSSAQLVTRAVGGEDVRNGQPAATVKNAVRSPEHGDRHPAWKRILSSPTCCD